jgi:CheY-like chemotaxis protein
LLATKAAEKGLDLLYYIDPSVPREVIGDVIRLKQVLLNLVSNALKFTEKGEILVTVTTLGNEAEIFDLEFNVKDTGLGIPQDKFHKLFSVFSQVDSSTTRKYGGSGLGLAICHRLVTLMSGTIHAESEFGVGSSFIFNIKVEINRNAIHYNSKSKAQQVQLKGKKILILDDNKTNLKILRLQCEQWNMIPVVTDKYEDALREAEQPGFDLAIVDLLMPEKDGIEVAQLLSNKQPNLPIILFSSAGFIPESEAKIKDLFAAVINKPIKQSQIERTFVEVLISAARAKKHVALPEAAGPTQYSPIKILVAEDSDINQKMIMRTLDKLGFRYDLAEDGMQALSKLREQTYQLVFMDIMMPVMDGYEATRIINKEFGPKERPVIIAMTANALTGDREKIMAAGMDDYISKPFKMQEIKDKIEAWKTKLMEQL